MSGKVASSDELKEMGREVASAMLKGEQAARMRVPLPTLMWVANNHELTELDPASFGVLAKAMDEALEEAARWNETDAQAELAGKGG